MLLASWLAPLVQTIGNAFTQKTKRRASRKSLTTQRWLANSWIERLEDRTVLSTSVTISPVFAGTIFDQNLDGTGDNSGLTYYSGGQPTVGNRAYAP
ncbi:hypothetical protein LBMAG52_44320 [Planctomycetia bacterium]|nr:hypothetical protein LBMAG52_44320 [Planctomycetia bacterium]